MPSGNNSISASPPMGWAWSRPGTAEATFHEGLPPDQAHPAHERRGVRPAFAVALRSASAAFRSLLIIGSGPGPAVRKIAPQADDVPTIRLMWRKVVVLTQRYCQDRSSSSGNYRTSPMCSSSEQARRAPSYPIRWLERGFSVVCLEQGDWANPSDFPANHPEWEAADSAAMAS